MLFNLYRPVKVESPLELKKNKKLRVFKHIFPIESQIDDIHLYYPHVCGNRLSSSILK